MAITCQGGQSVVHRRHASGLAASGETVRGRALPRRHARRDWQGGTDAVFSLDPPNGLGTGVPYFRPVPGVPFDF